MDIPEGITPEELRREADRRDLVTRATQFAQRRTARNAVVADLLVIDGRAVKDCGATTILRDAVARLAQQDADDVGEPTNGEIWALNPPGVSGTARNEDWWKARNVPHVDAHPMIVKMRCGGGPTWH